MALNETSTASRSLDHAGEVLLHRGRVQRVDACRLGDAAGSDDVLGDRVQLRQVASCQEEPCPLARERPGDGAADRASGRVDHGGLVLEQQRHG